MSIKSWDRYRERSTPWTLKLLVKTTLLVGRRPMQPILWAVAGYFWLTSPRARRVSRDYLQRVLGKPPAAGLVLRHFRTFATVSVDRIFLLAGRRAPIQVNAHVPENVLRTFAAERGCLLLVAHFGSFEALRMQGTRRHEAPIRIVLDRQVGRMAMRLLESLNPTLAAHIIDASRRGPEVVLDIKRAVDAGDIVGIMADRARADERSVTVPFLGGKVQLPAGPWIVAASLGAPVVLGFGVYHEDGGDARYECHLELFSERISLSRAARTQAITDYAAAYAQHLEHYVRAAPLNWFNFYEYWLPK